MTIRRRTTSCFPVNNMGQLDVDYHTSKQISQKPRLRLDYSLAFLIEILAEVNHVPDVLSLVDVQTVKVYHLRECLYAHGQSFQLLLFHIHKSVKSNNAVILSAKLLFFLHTQRVEGSG